MVTFAAYTNNGNRIVNEDSNGTAYRGSSLCFVVADGLGGHGGGEIASGKAVDAVCNTFIEQGWSESFFEKAFSRAQKEILDEQELQHTPSRMKTTLVVLVLHEGKIHYAHIGDSRLYIFQQKKEQNPDSYVGFRRNADGDSHRDARDVPVQEVANAIYVVLYEQISMGQDDLLRETANKLGYTRLGSNVLTALALGIQYAQAQGGITTGANGTLVLTADGTARGEATLNRF